MQHMHQLFTTKQTRGGGEYGDKETSGVNTGQCQSNSCQVLESATKVLESVRVLESVNTYTTIDMSVAKKARVIASRNAN